MTRLLRTRLHGPRGSAPGLIRPRLSRRAVLHGLGGLTIGLPLLDAMLGSSAQAEPKALPKRLIVMYTPNGTIASKFWPSGDEENFTLSPILEPLAAHKSRLLVVSGVDMLSSLNGPGDAHQRGTGQCLTATELLEGDFMGDGGASAGWAGGISLDQAVANHIGNDTVFRSLELGVAVQGASVLSRISYLAANQPLPPENSPYAAYQRLFGDSLGDPLEIERRTARRKTVLDAVAEQHAKLRDKLGSEDREKLIHHLHGIDEIRARLDESVIQFDGVCQPLDQGMPLDPEIVANMPIVGKLQMDLLAMALACDITRVGTLMWSNSAANHVLSFVDPAIVEGHHSIAHKGDEDHDKVEQNMLINKWYAEQFAYLLDRLAALPEGDGSVLDNTLVLWTNEQTKGNNHDRHDMPYVLAGNAGGYFKTGRYIQFNGQKLGHNRLLVSVLNAMGIETNEFGNPEYGTGPLPGLT
jgi:hypothetical protein